MLFAYLALIALTSVVIMYACNTFEDAADHLGRNMAPGVKGATINAIGSSLPELFTTLLFLFGPAFLVKNSSPEELFSAGIATCAGSAIFNAVIIPGLCILAVMFIGVKKKGGREKVTSIELNKKVVVKDGFFFLFSEIALIYFLGMQKLTYIMGFSLMAIYVIYIMVTLKGGFAGDEDDDADDDDGADEDDDEDEGGVGILGLGWLLDFNRHFFGGRELSEDEGNGRAWVLLSLSTIFIGIACGGIVFAVEGAAHELGVSLYVTAVLLAAAATSVPDTVLSVKDAMKGDYDDAVANAVGSNIFDICICLGFPLALYSLINSDIMLQSDTDGGDVQVLRFILILASVLILAIFLIGRSIGKAKAVMLFSIYFLWTAFIIGGAQTPKAEWTQAVKVPAFLSVQSAPADGATKVETKPEPKADPKTEAKPADK